MSRAKLLADLKAASADYATAQRQLAAERFNVQHGIAHNLMFAESREHVAYHRWLGAHEAFATSAPKLAPKPTPKASDVAPRDPGAEAVADYWRR
ncbi:hypothetical protein TSA1_15880 [Bradyrhizobium nitroreducens]|uniref:Uncharacterized protein n=1 Tax=Bradyrhizobium nitroreducens TaxID=709803 RepID=A0A2M6UBS8_9BRAD|nr:hypothetical protein [Bradyrhizobium nitroreducens]PIT02074.1 hypothetical protein TSA1_15880 [Bradyrhizobium nitroreducens]